MKKSIINATLLLVAIIISTSCVHDNKKQQTPKEVKLQYEYNMFCHSDILEFADIEITYADGDGTLITDTITSEQTEVSSSDSEPMVEYFHTNININAVPTRLYMTFRYLPKDDITVSTDQSVSTAGWMEVDGRSGIDGYRVCENPIQSVKASELKAFFNKFNENPPSLDYTLQEKSGILTNALELVKNN